MPYLSPEMLANKASASFKEFTQSGRQNITRTILPCIMALFAGIITTLIVSRELSFTLLLQTMFVYFKAWIPILAWLVGYVFLGIAMKINPNNTLERMNGRKTDNGVQMAVNATYGSAAWMSKKEAYAQLEVANIDRCKGVILGGFDENGNETVCIPWGDKKNRAITNQNVCIFGSPGEGKSWGYARCNMLQAIRSGKSVMVTDPKGELYTDMCKIFKDNGYTVKCFNLSNPSLSDAWNCMNVCYSRSTGNVDLMRVKAFVDAIMKNTSDPNDLKDYFANNERTLFEAVIMYMAEKYSLDVRARLQNIVFRCCTPYDDKETIRKFRMRYVRSDSEMNSMIRDAKEIFLRYGPDQTLTSLVISKGSTLLKYSHIDWSNIDDYLSGMSREDLFEFYFDIYTSDIIKPTLSNVYNKINNLNISVFATEVGEMGTNTPLCKIPLSTIMQQSEQVWPNFINGCSVRLNVLNDEGLRLMLSEDDIDLALPGQEKCAYFCIFPDQDVTFQFVSSLFFTFLFKDQIETSDDRVRRGLSPNPVAVDYILDEFANIGIIPEFTQKISAARSRNIGITMIIQTITQLYQNYSKDVANTILGCCSTLICLGVNDPVTIKYFVDYLGETTIVARSTKDERKVGRLDRLLPEYSESLGEGKRNLLTFDEMRRIDPSELVVVMAHLKPLLLKKVTANHHPLSNNGNFEKTSIADIRPFVERYPGCEQRDSFALVEYLRVETELSRLNRGDISAEPGDIPGGSAEVDSGANEARKTDSREAPVPAGGTANSANSARAATSSQPSGFEDVLSGTAKKPNTKNGHKSGKDKRKHEVDNQISIFGSVQNASDIETTGSFIERPDKDTERDNAPVKYAADPVPHKQEDAENHEPWVPEFPASEAEYGDIEPMEDIDLEPLDEDGEEPPVFDEINYSDEVTFDEV